MQANKLYFLKMKMNDWKDQLSQLAEGELHMKEELDKLKEEAPQEGSLGKQHFRVELDKAGRKGKQATLITGFEGDDEELKQLAAELKKCCGVGGSCRGGEILIQGDLRDKIGELLSQKGHKVKIIR